MIEDFFSKIKEGGKVYFWNVGGKYCIACLNLDRTIFYMLKTDKDVENRLKMPIFNFNDIREIGNDFEIGLNCIESGGRRIEAADFRKMQNIWHSEHNKIKISYNDLAKHIEPWDVVRFIFKDDYLDVKVNDKYILTRYIPEMFEQSVAIAGDKFLDIKPFLCNKKINLSITPIGLRLFIDNIQIIIAQRYTL